MVIEEDDRTNYNKDKAANKDGNDDAGSNAEGSGKEDSDDEKAKAKKKARSKSKRPKLDAVRWVLLPVVLLPVSALRVSDPDDCFSGCLMRRQACLTLLNHFPSTSSSSMVAAMR